jgi:hypothetical protein
MSHAKNVVYAASLAAGLAMSRAVVVVRRSIPRTLWLFFLVTCMFR